MEKLITSYFIDHEGVHLSIGKMYGILCVCKRCRKYEIGKCGKGEDGISICRYGCSVYEEKNIVYFGLQLKDYCKSNKVLKFDLPLVMSFQQFLILQSYDKQFDEFKEMRQKALQFSEEYDRCVMEIQGALPDPKGEGWGKDRIITTLSGFAMARVLNAINALKMARQKFSSLFSRPRFKDLLPFISNGTKNNSLISSDSRCLRCRNYECNKGNSYDTLECDFNRCSKGVFFIKGFARTYYGVCVFELERKRLKDLKRKKKVLFSKQRLIDLIKFINLSEYEINTAWRFLHDAGQYLAAIQNLLPYTNIGRSQNATIKVSSLISINATTMALQCLKRQLFEGVRRSKRRHEFSPYQLFDKYRYCFGESYGRIKLTKVDGRDFYELISSYEGFEFAVLNLLSNAIKYLPADERYNTVDIRFNHTNKGIEIAIESMGVKVDDVDLSRLGIRWFRGRSAIEASVPGEGLGLHAVVTCMRQSGFRIRFFSSGKVEHINGIDYRKFSAIIQIPRRYVVNSGIMSYS